MAKPINEVIHSQVLRAYTFSDDYARTFGLIKVARTIRFRKYQGILLTDRVDETLSRVGIQIHPEVVEYIFSLEGIPKKLFLYLLFYGTNPTNNQIVYNQQVQSDFKNFNQLLGGKAITQNTLDKALRTLVKFNVVQSIKRGKYMLNPVIAGGKTNEGRRTLIQDYSMLLITKHGDGIKKFYPTFAK